MVEMNFDGEDNINCEGCGTEIPAFLDACPYCESDPQDGTLPCPSCGIEIHEDSQRCPLCGAWVTMAVQSKSRLSPRVLGVLLVLLVLSLILALVLR